MRAIPIVVKDRIPRSLLKSTLVNSADTVHVIDAQFAGPNSDYGTVTAVGGKECFIFSMGESNPQDPEAGKRDGPVSVGNARKRGEQCRPKDETICQKSKQGGCGATQPCEATSHLHRLPKRL